MNLVALLELDQSPLSDRGELQRPCSPLAIFSAAVWGY